MSDHTFEPPPEDLGGPEDLEAMLATLGTDPQAAEPVPAVDLEQETGAAGEGEPSGVSLASVKSELDDLSELVAELGEGTAWAIDQLTEHPAGGPWLWEGLEPESEQALWKELGEFVTWLNNRILNHLTSGDAESIPGCWYQHPPAVEQLTALMVAHKAAYHPKTKKASFELVNWFDRALWPTMRALKDTNVLAGCTPGYHHQNDIEHYSHDEGFWVLAGLDGAAGSGGELTADA